MKKEELILLAKDKKFESQFLFNKPYKHNPTKEVLRWYFWLCELQKWLREKHEHNIVIQKCVGKKIDGSTEVSYTNSGSPWDAVKTYEQALEEGVAKALQLI